MNKEHRLEKSLPSTGRLLLLAALLTLRCITGCPFSRLFRTPCPGCGLTRAWLCFLSGDWAAALDYHPLFLPAPVFVLLFALRDGRKANVRGWMDLFLFLFALLCLLVLLGRL